MRVHNISTKYTKNDILDMIEGMAITCSAPILEGDTYALNIECRDLQSAKTVMERLHKRIIDGKEIMVI